MLPLSPNISSPRLLSKNTQIGIYKNIILSRVVYGCENLVLISKEEEKHRVFKNLVLKIMDKGEMH
jgi:hypothetical protein